MIKKFNKKVNQHEFYPRLIMEEAWSEILNKHPPSSSFELEAKLSVDTYNWDTSLDIPGINVKELDQSIDIIKSNKAPGEDEFSNKIIKILPKNHRMFLASFYVFIR